MVHTAIDDPTGAVEVQPGAVVSKVLFRGGGLDVTVLAFDAGEGLTEHTATRAAIVEVLSGRMRVRVDEVEHDAGPGWWLHMAPGTPHGLEAIDPSRILLTLLPA